MSFLELQFQSPPSHICNTNANDTVGGYQDQGQTSNAIRYDGSDSECTSSIPVNTRTPTIPTPIPPSAGRNDDLLHQNEPSIAALDRLQRQRREESERRNAELQSFTIMDKLRNAHDSLLNISGSNGISCDMVPDTNPNKNTFTGSSISGCDMNTPGSARRVRVRSRRHQRQRRMRLGRGRSTASSTARTGAPAPKLRIRRNRSNSNSFFSDNDGDSSAPVIILPDLNTTSGHSESFGELFPSPHSSKFVLQFPNAPSQEFNLEEIDSDLVTNAQHVHEFVVQGQHSEQSQNDHDRTYQDHSQNQHQGEESPNEDCANSESIAGTLSRQHFHTPFVLRPIESKPSFSLDTPMTTPNHTPDLNVPSPNSSMTTASPNTQIPLPTKRCLYRKTRILLKPKRRISTSEFESGSQSPGNCSNSTCSSSLEVRRDAGDGSPQDLKFGVCMPIQTLSNLNLNGSANDKGIIPRSGTEIASPVPIIPKYDSNKQSPIARTSTSAFLSLKPKRLKRPAGSPFSSTYGRISAHNQDALQRKNNTVAKEEATSYADESGDMLMELDPNMSISKDLDLDLSLRRHDGRDRHEEGKNEAAHQLNFTSHHYRCPSVSFMDECDNQNYNVRSRTQSSCSIQSQIEMAKEAAARAICASPLSLSESDFRTPNPSSARKRGYYRSSFSGTAGSNGTTSGDLKESPREDEKKKMMGLFLPKLFPSASEEDIQGTLHSIESAGAGSAASSMNKSRSNSFFEMMKDAFSPKSWKKSPPMF